MRDKNFSMAWFHKLRKLADSRGFSGPSLSTHFDVTGQAVNKWLAGGAEPSYQDLLKLCNILKAPVEWVLDDSQSDEPPSPEHQTARNMYYRVLTERGPEAVIACLAGASMPVSSKPGPWGRDAGAVDLPYPIQHDKDPDIPGHPPIGGGWGVPSPEAASRPPEVKLQDLATQGDPLRPPKGKRKPR